MMVGRGTGLNFFSSPSSSPQWRYLPLLSCKVWGEKIRHVVLSSPSPILPPPPFSFPCCLEIIQNIKITKPREKGRRIKWERTAIQDSLLTLKTHSEKNIWFYHFYVMLNPFFSKAILHPQEVQEKLSTLLPPFPPFLLHKESGKGWKLSKARGRGS